MIDLDNFKQINDTFGHSVGDQVIKEVSKKIQLLFANFDLVGRFGGDEFLLFLKNSSGGKGEFPRAYRHVAGRNLGG